jgi:hypothetical protein
VFTERDRHGMISSASPDPSHLECDVTEPTPALGAPVRMGETGRAGPAGESTAARPGTWSTPRLSRLGADSTANGGDGGGDGLTTLSILTS